MRKIDQIINDECWPCCLAMVLDRPRRSIPYRSPTDPADFSKFWNTWFKSEGLVPLFWDGDYLRSATRADEPWIAIVPGGRVINHAVVMTGSRLFHDPYRWNPRVRAPRKILLGAIIRPEGHPDA